MAPVEPLEFHIPGPVELSRNASGLNHNLKKQIVLLGDDAITIFDKPGGKVLGQFRISELVQVVFHPIRFSIEGYKYKNPMGLILFARNWDEQRLGVRSMIERGNNLRGVYFSPEGGIEAENFFEALLDKDSYAPEPTPYILQIFSDTFTVSLTETELIINHIPTINHRIFGGGNEEVRCFISDISGVKLEVKGLRTGKSDESYGTLWFLTNLNREQRVNPISRLEKSPWSLTFPTSMKDSMSELSEIVRKKVEETKSNLRTSSSPSLSEEIRELADLREQGLITQDEFDAAKKKILGT